MRQTNRFFVATAFSLLFFACSGSAKIAQGNDASAGVLTPNSLTSASVQISAQTGGYVNVGSAQLKIPAQAIDQDTEITAEVVDIALPAGGAQAMGKGIRLQPEGLQFLVPAELEICYGANDAANLNASQAMIYYQSHDQGFVGIAGNVDVSRRCVKSPIEHFSSYVAAAYAVNPGNTAPQFAGINFLPATPTPGVPLRVRVQINDVNGGATPGHVVAATLTYSFDGGVTQLNLPLAPDATDDTVTNRYYAEIPANQVSGTTFSYAITAVDNLNASRRTPTAAGTFTSVAMGAAATAIRFNPATFTAVAPLQISAGFSRQLALQVTSNGTTWQNISAENVVSLSSASLGSIIRIAPSSVRFNAVGAGSGQIIANVGSLSTSAYVNVAPGLLTHIEITDVNQVIISGTGNLAAGQTYDFDVIGFDSYGNIASVLPAMSTTGGIGTVSVDLTGLHFTASAAAGSGSIIATLAGLTDSISLNLYVAPQVTATAPFDNTAGIALNASVGVTFSQVMDTSTLTTGTTSACTGTLQVSSDEFVTCVPMASATPSFYASNTLAVIQPAANLLGNTTYKIRVTAAARNTLNQPLVEDYTTQVGFTTVAAPPLLGDALWASTSLPGTTESTLFKGVATDASGVYVVGSLSTGFFDFGSGVSITISTWGAGVLVKYDHSGIAQWARVVVAAQRPSGFTKVAVDQTGNVYVAGYQAGNGTNDYGNSVTITTTGFHPNAMLLKYDANGNALWGRVLNPSGPPYDVQSEYRNLHVSADGYVYVCGYYTGAAAASLSTTVTLPALNGVRTLVAKYDAAGEPIWVRGSETANQYASVLVSITTDGLGGVFAAGAQAGNSIVTYGPGITISTDNGGTSSALLLKYDTVGNTLWARVAAPPPSSYNAYSQFSGVQADSAGDVYVVGHQRGAYTFDYGNGITGSAAYGASMNAALVKYSGNGNAQWLRTATVAPAASSFVAIELPSDNEILVAGFQQGNGPFTYGSLLPVGTSNSSGANPFLLRFSAQGNVVAAKTLAAAADASGFEAISAVGAHVYAAGLQYYGGVYDFGAGITTIGAYSPGLNALLVKYQR